MENRTENDYIALTLANVYSSTLCTAPTTRTYYSMCNIIENIYRKWLLCWLWRMSTARLCAQHQRHGWARARAAQKEGQNAWQNSQGFLGAHKIFFFFHSDKVYYSSFLTWVLDVIHTHAHTHTHTHTHTKTRTHTQTRTHTYVHTHIHAHTRTHAHAHTRTRTHTHTHAHTHINTHAHTHTHSRTHSRTHTQAHTRTHAHMAFSAAL